MLVSDSEGRTLTLVPPPRGAEEGSGPIDTGLADVVTLANHMRTELPFAALEMELFAGEGVGPRM